MSKVALDVRSLQKDFGSLELRYARGLGAELASRHEIVLLYRYPFQLDMLSGAFRIASSLKPNLGIARNVNRSLNDLDVEVVFTLSPRFNRWGSKFKVIGTAIDRFGSDTRPSKSPRGIDRLVTSSVALANKLKNRNPKSTQSTCVYPGISELLPESGRPALAPSRRLLFAGEWKADLAGKYLVETMAVLGDFEIEFLRVLSNRTKREILKLAGVSADRIFFRAGLSSRGLQQELAHFFAVIFVDPLEGFGLTPLDCMALGVPVIISDTAIMQELAGPSGNYYSPTEPLSLASEVRELQRAGAWRRASEAGWRRASQFLWKHPAVKIERLIEELIG